MLHCNNLSLAREHRVAAEALKPFTPKCTRLCNCAGATREASPPRCSAPDKQPVVIQIIGLIVVVGCVLGGLLPGFGIVAAVLGIVNTMAALQGSDNDTVTIGHKVGAALVGTFLGILVSNGFVGPIAAGMGHHANEATKAFEVVKMALVATVRGYVPAVAIEFSRKLLRRDVRPTFRDLESVLKVKAKAAA
jgi:hypothetical protein